MKKKKSHIPRPRFAGRRVAKQIYQAPRRGVGKRTRQMRRADSRFRAPRKNISRAARWVIALFALCSLLFALYLIIFRSSIRTDVSFEVGRGASVSSVASQLKAADLIDSEYEFKLLVAGLGGRVLHGIYDIPTGSGVVRIAKMLAKGKVANTTIMIPEGLTVQQIYALLGSNQFLRGDSCPRDETGRFADCHRDGELFPDTYRVAKGTPRTTVLQMMRKKMQDIERNWSNTGRRLPSPLKTWNEVVTLASIVQKETPRVSEMPIVASVYLNRLRKKMRLQADPTVVYAITDGLGDMQGKPLYTGHLKIDSPYNTYVNYGLPPHPIANVGADAIRAVLNPADTNYYFFVADGTGGHVFAKDYAEHTANHAKWREIKKSRR